MSRSRAQLVETAERILRTACGPRVRVAFPLAPLTSFRLGGPAALYLEAESDPDLVQRAAAVGTIPVGFAGAGTPNLPEAFLHESPDSAADGLVNARRRGAWPTAVARARLAFAAPRPEGALA